MFPNLSKFWTSSSVSVLHSLDPTCESVGVTSRERGLTVTLTVEGWTEDQYYLEVEWINLLEVDECSWGITTPWRLENENCSPTSHSLLMSLSIFDLSTLCPSNTFPPSKSDSVCGFRTGTVWFPVLRERPTLYHQMYYVLLVKLP